MTTLTLATVSFDSVSSELITVPHSREQVLDYQKQVGHLDMVCLKLYDHDAKDQLILRSGSLHSHQLLLIHSNSVLDMIK